MSELTNQIMPILVQAILGVLAVVVGALAKVAIEYINTYKQLLISKIGTQNYNIGMYIAEKTYYMVEQQFKGIEVAAEEKKKLFDSILLQMIPGLSQEELDHFRESTVGNINQQIKQSEVLKQAK